MTGSAKRDLHDPRAAANGAGRKASKAEPVLDRAVQAQIGTKLRAMYGALEDEPVPDRLVALLGRLGGTNPGERA